MIAGTIHSKKRGSSSYNKSNTVAKQVYPIENNTNKIIIQK